MLNNFFEIRLVLFGSLVALLSILGFQYRSAKSTDFSTDILVFEDLLRKEGIADIDSSTVGNLFYGHLDSATINRNLTLYSTVLSRRHRYSSYKGIKKFCIAKSTKGGSEYFIDDFDYNLEFKSAIQSCDIGGGISKDEYLNGVQTFQKINFLIEHFQVKDPNQVSTIIEFVFGEKVIELDVSKLQSYQDLLDNGVRKQSPTQQLSQVDKCCLSLLQSLEQDFALTSRSRVMIGTKLPGLLSYEIITLQDSVQIDFDYHYYECNSSIGPLF